MRETKVRSTSPAIRKILDATVGADWSGTHVIIYELPTTWRYTGSRWDSRNPAWMIDDVGVLLATGKARISSPPSAPSQVPYHVEHLAPHDREVIVRKKIVGPVEIIISEAAVDSDAIAIATDALLSRDQPAAKEAADVCGATAELCLALANAHARALSRGENVGDLTAALTSTTQTPAAKRAKKSAAQLEREIASALSRRR